MHSLTGATDPLIVSLSGSVSLSTPVVNAIQSGALEPEGAFARFSGTSHALAPYWFESKQLEAHEAFWCFDDDACSPRIDGELAWFQTGVYAPSAALVSVPLLIHAGGAAVEQLGKCAFTSVRVQVPSVERGLDEEAIQQLVDQFSVMEEVHPAVKIHAQINSRTRPEQWTSAAKTWFKDTYLEPLSVQNLAMSDDRVVFDERWAFRRAGGVHTAMFSAPEWSLSVASTIAVLMVEAGRAAGINETIIVDVNLG